MVLTPLGVPTLGRWEIIINSKFPTLNYSNISLSFDQASSNTGPGSFQLEYSTNGSTFTNIGSAYTVLANASPNTTWNNATYNSAYTLTPNLSSVSSALSNDPTLYFRLVDAGTVSANGGTIGTSGTRSR